jgi:cellulase/cellobiase CelA1
VSQETSEICKALGPYTPLPIVKPEAFCASSGFSTDKSMCVLLDLVEKGVMAASNDASGTTCSAAKQTLPPDTSVTGKVVQRVP